MADFEQEQEDILATLAEHARSTPDRGSRWFLTMSSMGEPENVFSPTGVAWTAARSDVDVLVSAGLLTVLSYEQYNQIKFYVSPEGFAHYEEVKHAAGSLEAIEEDIKRYIDGDSFRDAFPAAYALWSEAANLLWGADSEQQLTTIGHKAREAMQACATALVERHQPPGVETDPAKIKNRVGAAIDANRERLGERRSELLDGLFAYWEGVNGIVQRQEHAGAKHGDAVTWEDARRVVLHTAVTMTELARELM